MSTHTQTSGLPNVVIVGGGLVGSLLSCYLARRGYTVDVYERRSDPRKEGYSGGRSINLALSHRGWRALSEVGLEDTLRQIAVPMKGRMVHALDGAVNFQPYSNDGQSIFSVSRGGLNVELIKYASTFPNVNFYFDQRCLDVNLSKSSILFEHTGSGQQTYVESALILGTDGAFSAVRGAMQKTDRFNYSQQYLLHGYKELSIPAGESGSFLMEKNALHIWPRKSFMLIALPNLDGSFTVTLFLAFDGQEHAFSELKSHDKVRRFFEEQFADIVPLIPNLTDMFFSNPASSLVTVRCSPWVYGDNIALLGDAAHAIVPFYGQGMNAGFEDCRVLNDLLNTHNDDWSAVLPLFQEQRIPNANGIADLALQNFIEMRDLVSDPDFLLRKKIEARIHAAYPDVWIPLYTMVTFSHIPYQEALVIGRIQEEIMLNVLKTKDIGKIWTTIPVEPMVEELKNRLAKLPHVR